MKAEDLIREALFRGQTALSEHDSKELIRSYGVPVAKEALCRNAEEAASIASGFGFPVALKACSPELMHKSEAGVVELNLRGEREVRDAYKRVVGRTDLELDGVLVQEMVRGQRELVIGLNRDPQFGPCVMLGIGGVMTELLDDASFRMAPFDMAEALDMTEELRMKAVLGAFRGQQPADLDALCRSLVAVGKIGLELDAVSELDVNPLIITPEGSVVAVDALAVLRRENDDIL